MRSGKGGVRGRDANFLRGRWEGKGRPVVDPPFPRGVDVFLGAWGPRRGTCVCMCVWVFFVFLGAWVPRRGIVCACACGFFWCEKGGAEGRW